MSHDEQNQLTEIYESDDPSKFENAEISLKLITWFQENVEMSSQASRTAALWLSYSHYVSIIQEFIRAERTSDWSLHISTTKSMLNLFAATGHNNYAKTCRLYLQSVNKFEKQHPEVINQFIEGHHTVKRAERKWAGLFTDLSIEQVLMKSLKGRSGVVGKGITENVFNVWTKTMHRCAEVADAVSSLVSTSSNPATHHKDLYSARVKRDYEDFVKIQCWFQSHNPFDIEEKLCSLDSGLIDENGSVTCDRAEEIGSMIQSSLDGNKFTDCSFKRKNQIVNLQSLYSTINIDANDSISIDPLTLFLRLIVVVEKKPENEVVSYFNYELTPYPMSLFKDGLMRPAQKSKLKTFILKDVPQSKEPTESKRIADGGAFLWCCNWKKDELFSDIFKRYLNFLRHLRINVVIFDGYDLSTKDATHQKRKSRICQTVEVNDQNPCPSDRTTFLKNYTNKEKFVKLLAERLEMNGIEVVRCPSDADTTIVKVAMRYDPGTPVVIFSDDTDILCLLLHHMNGEHESPNIFLMNMSRQKANKERECYNIKDVIDETEGMFLVCFSICR